MKKFGLALGLIALPLCSWADSLTPRLGLVLITTGTSNWGVKLNTSITSVLDSSVAAQGVTNTFTSSNTFKAAVGVSSSVLAVNGTGAGIYTSGSSTAAYFYGNGSALTGITASGGFPSTGAAVTAALNGAGTSASPLGASFSSVTSRAVFDAFIATAGPMGEANRVSLSTNMPVLESLRVSASTNMPVLEALRVSASTNMPVVESLRVSMSTNMPFLATRASSGTNADITQANALATIGTSLTTIGSMTATQDGKFFGSLVVVSSASVSSITATQNGAGTVSYTNAPMVSYGNTPGFLQNIIQNFSNAATASANYIVTGDLGGNTSFYMEIGVNSSKFSDAFATMNKSSMAYVSSSDSDLAIWAGINGDRNGATNGSLIFGSSTPNSGNIALIISSATATLPGAATFRSSVTVQSSATVKGYFEVAGGTFSVNAGAVSAPSQPFVALSSPTNTAIPNGVETQVFWVNKDTDTAGFFVAASSNIVTARSSGLYFVQCQVSVNLSNTELEVYVYRNGFALANMETLSDCDPVASSSESTCSTSKVIMAAANDTFRCSVFQNTASATFLNTAKRRTFLTAVKLW